MSTYGQNILTETVEYIDAGTVFDTIITKKIAALNTSSQSNIDLFIGATGNINMNLKGYNAIRFNQKDTDDFTTQISALNSQPIEVIPGDNSRTATISDITLSQSVTKQTIKTKKGILVLDDDIEISGSLTLGQDFLVGGALIGSSMNTLRTFSNANSKTSIGFGWRVDDNSNLELYKFDNSTNVTKKILTYGIGETGDTQDTTSYPVYGSNPAQIYSGVEYATHQSDNLWSSNGTDVYFTAGRMGIGTSTPSYPGHFIGDVYSSTGFRTPHTIINNGDISCCNITTTDTITASYFSGDGYLLTNLNAANITLGKFQTAMLPNIITANEISTDTLATSRLDVTGDIYFTGNLYQNQELFVGGNGSGSTITNITNVNSLWSNYNSTNNLYYTLGNVGIGTSSALYTLDIKGITNISSNLIVNGTTFISSSNILTINAGLILNTTSAITVPVGSTLERPSTSNIGMFRYNTDLQAYEGFANNNWAPIASSGSGTTVYNFNSLWSNYNSTNNLYYTLGNVGIGTSNALYTLDIKGIANISSNLIVNGTIIKSSNNNLEIDSGLIVNTTSAITVPVGSTAQRPSISNVGMLRYNTDLQSYEGFSNNTWAPITGSSIGTNIYNNNINSLWSNYNSTESIYYMLGNVGIGTSSALYTLDVKGITNISSNLIVNGTTFISSNNNLTINSSLVLNNTSSMTVPVGTTSQRPTTTTVGMLRYNTDLQSYEGFTNSIWTPIASLWSNNTSVNSLCYAIGNVGIGTSSALYTLDVKGIANISSNLIVNGTTFISSNNNLTINSSLVLNNTSSMTVPVGTTSQRPTTTTVGMLRYNTDLQSYEGFTSNIWSPIASLWSNNTSVNSLCYATGNVGIGTSSVTNKLEVVGNTQLTGDLLVNSGDIYLDGQLFTTTFQTTASNIYYTGHKAMVTSNYSTSNNIYTSTDYSTIFGLTDKFLNLVDLNLPTNLPVIYPTNYTIKATKNLTITLSANINGSTAYVGSDVNNAPLYTYIGDVNEDIQVSVPLNYYLAIVGI